jgi:hypothetical protein
MAVLPNATLTINEEAGGFASGDSYIVIMSPVSKSADYVPRVFASAAGLLSQYNYSPGIDYCAMHFGETGLPVIFVGLPISVPGVIVRQDQSGVTGTSQVSIAVGSSGSMEKTSGVLVVAPGGGGTIGTSQILFNLSCDGGATSQPVRLGTNTSYTIPSLGLVLSFGAGTLNVGDTFAWTSTAPMWGSTAMTTALAALQAQQNLSRSWLIDGEVPSSTYANFVVTAATTYATQSQRYTFARAQVADFLPLPESSRLQAQMTGAPALTFAATGHTITRATGSWITDGFQTGDLVTVAGSTANNGVVGACTVTSATVLTFSAGVVNESDTAGSTTTVTSSPAITFAASGQTVTRSRGSFLTEGFAVGQMVTYAGATNTANNLTAAISALSATVMTFASGSGITNEGPDAMSGVYCAVVQTFGGDVALQTTNYGAVNSSRIDLGYGHGTKQSPLTGWLFRRPVEWAASLREYQHDVEIATYRKSDGVLLGWEITDDNGNIVEYDETTDGGALAGRFTCFRTYENGPLGAFIALSLTRDTDGSILSRTQNATAANLASTICQTATENAIGQTLILNPDGTGTSASLSLLEKTVNKSLQVNLLGQYEEGPRVSGAVWAASRTDILSSPGATLNGTLTLNINGTIEQIATQANVS